MRVEQQGHSECMLSTIAALAHRPLAEVRAIACRKAGVRVWRGVFRKRAGVRHVLFARSIIATCQELDGTGRLAAMVNRVPATVAHGTGIVVHTSRATLPERTLPSKGIGTVVIRSPRGRAHIAPWQDGIVYDPNKPDEPCTLVDFAARYRMFVVSVTVTQEPNANPEDCPTPSPDMGY